MLKPLGDRIVIELIQTEEKQRAELSYQTQQKKTTRRKVVAVGSGRVLDNGERVAPEVSVGDRIIFSKYAGTEVKYDGKEYLILRESDILAVIG